jgi:hypothetical protein
MHIFIDESGSFAGGSSQNAVSMVGALVIPDQRMKLIERKYKKIRVKLPTEKGEVKGRLLDEGQIDTVVRFLASHDLFFEAIAIDLALHTTASIERHKKGQEGGITNSLTEKHHPNMVEWMWNLRRRLEAMQHPLYLQSVATFELIYRTIEHATIFYCQRWPKELAAFRWIIDGKGKDKKVDWEDWWSTVIMPILESKSFREPMAMLVGGNYAYFDRFTTADITDYKRGLMSDPMLREATDIGKLMTEHFRFSSLPEAGLELVDILVNATRRAMVGNLSFDGWKYIPHLMIHVKSRQYISMIALGDGPTSAAGRPYAPVLRHFRHGGKSMLVPGFRSPANGGT